jgi:hypothetical protein
MLTYLSSGNLPFIKDTKPLMEQFERIKKRKNKYSPSKICT